MNYLLPEEIRSLLTNWALRPDSPADLKEIFGTDDSRADSFIEQIKGGDFSWIPKIEILPSGILNGALGAYARSTATIYLSDTCAEERVGEVLLEEIGHHIDALINPYETPGDEGTLFSATVLGLSLSKAEIEAILNEDDSTTITIAGRAILVECASDTLGINTNNPLDPASPYTLPPDYNVATLSGSNSYQLTGNSNATNQLIASELKANVSLIAGTAQDSTLVGGSLSSWLDASSNPLGGTVSLSARGGGTAMLTSLVGLTTAGATSLRVASTKNFFIGQKLTTTGLAAGTTVLGIDSSKLTSAALKNAKILKLASAAGFVRGETLTGPAFASGTTVLAISGNSISLSKGLLSSLEVNSPVIGDGRIVLSAKTGSSLSKGTELSGIVNTTMIGGAGTSILDGSLSKATQSLVGGSGDNTIYGGIGTASLIGGAGNNLIVSGDASTGNVHYLLGGVSTLNSTLIGGKGQDILRGGNGANTLISGSTTLAHSLYGNGDSNSLVAGQAADTLIANQGLAALNTLDGRYSASPGINDSQLLSGTAKVVQFGSANKQSRNYMISGSNAKGSQTLVGHGGYNTLVAGQGRDMLTVWNNDAAKNSNNVYLFNKSNIANHNIVLTTLSGAKNSLGLSYTPPAMELSTTATIGDTLLSVVSATGFVVGEQITGYGIASGTTITAITSNAGGTTVGLSNAVTDDIAVGSSLSGSALHTSVSSTLTSGSYAIGTKLLKVASTTGFAVGDYLSGNGIASGATIAAIDTLNSNISLSAGLSNAITSGTQIAVNVISVLDSDLSHITGGGTLGTIVNYGPGSASVELGANASKLGVSTIVAGNNGDIFTELASYTGTLSLQGGSGNDLLSADNTAQLIRGDFQGGGGLDTIQINTSSTLNDTFFSSLGANIDVLKLSDSIGSYNQVSLAGKATEFGITSVYGGAGKETISQLTGSGSFYLNTGDNNDLIRVVNATYLSADTINGGNKTDTLQSDTLQLGLGVNQTSGVVATVSGASGYTLATVLNDAQFLNLSNIDVLTINGGSSSYLDTITGETKSVYGLSNVTLGGLAYNTGIKKLYGSDGGDTFTQTKLNGSLTTLGPAVSAGATSIRVTTNTNLRVGDVIESSGIVKGSKIVAISQDTSKLSAAASSGTTLLAVGSADAFAIGETLSGTGIASGTAITAIDRSSLLESAASASKSLHISTAGGFVVGEKLSGTGIAAGTTISSITQDLTTLTSSIAGGSKVLNVASTTPFVIGESLISPSESLTGSGITPGTTIVGIDRSTILQNTATASNALHVGSTAGFILGDIISGTGIASGSILLSTSVDSTTLLEAVTSGSTTLHVATSGGFVVGETLSGTGIASGTKINSLLQDSTILRTLASSGSKQLSVVSADQFVVGETISGTGIAAGTSITAVDRSTLLDSVAFGSTKIHVGNTSGFVKDELLSGSGIVSGTTISNINPDTFALLDSAPAGSSYLHYNPASADKLSIGETLFGSVFATGTFVKSIDTMNSVITLSKNMLDTLAAGSIVTGGGILTLSKPTTSMALGSPITGQGYLSLSTATTAGLPSGSAVTGGYQLNLSGGTSGSLASGSSLTGGGVLTLSKVTTASLPSGSAVTGTGHLSLSSGVSGNISDRSTITGAGGVLLLSANTSSNIASGSQITGQGYLSLSDTLQANMASGSQITGEYQLSLSSGLDNSIAAGSQILAASPVQMWGGLGNDVFSVAYTNLNENLTGYSVEEMKVASLMASDTLNTVIITGQASINGDNFLNSLTGIQRLQLNSSAGNSVTLSGKGTNMVTLTLSGNGANTITGGTGIGTVVAGAGSDTIDASDYINSVTLDATKAKFANKIYPADSLLGSYTKASSFYFSDAGVFGLSTVKGGIANDTVVLNAAAVLLDQEFTNKSDIDVISLQAGGSVMIGNMAMTAGIDSFYGGNGNDTFIQTTADTKAVYINGGGGSNTYLIYNTTLLSGLQDPLSPLAADTLQRDTIIGGDGADILIINDTFTSNLDPNLPAPPASLFPATYLNGYDLRYVQNVDQLSLAGSAFVSLSAADSGTGIRSILGGLGADTFISGISSSYLRSGTGNSFLQAGQLGDYAFGMGRSAYITLSGGGNGGTSALLYSNTLIAYGNSDVIIAGNNGDRIEAWGQRDIINSGKGDTTYIYNTDASINAGSNNRIIFDNGSINGAQFTTQSLNYTSSTINGGDSSDTLQFNKDITLNNSFYNISNNGVGGLWLMGDGKSSVTLGESADFRGIATVVAGLGNYTVDGSAYTNRQLNYDLRQSSSLATNLLTGSNVLFDPYNGTRFLFNDTNIINNGKAQGDTFVGNTLSSFNGSLCGVDTLAYAQATLPSGFIPFYDTLYSTERLKNIDVISAAADYRMIDGSLVGHNWELGDKFQATGITTVLGSNSGDNFYVTNGLIGANSTFVSGTSGVTKPVGGGGTIITMASVSNFTKGDFVTGLGIAPNTAILDVDKTKSTITLSNGTTSALAVGQALYDISYDTKAASTLSAAAAQGDTQITMGSSSNFKVGDFIRGSGIALNTTILDVVNKVITLSTGLIANMEVGSAAFDIAPALTGARFQGGSQGDKFYLNGNYLNSTYASTVIGAATNPIADKFTLDGGSGNNGLVFTKSGITLSDSGSTSDFANVKNMQGLQFDTVQTGVNAQSNKVTLDKYATLSGLASVVAGNGDSSGKGDTLIQNGNFSNSFSLIGGKGDDLFELSGSSLLGGVFISSLAGTAPGAAGTTIIGNDYYISGGASNDVLWFYNNPVNNTSPNANNVVMTDAMFANIKNMEILTLSGGTNNGTKFAPATNYSPNYGSLMGAHSITMGLNASLSGIRTVLGSWQSDSLYNSAGDTIISYKGGTFTQTSANNVGMNITGSYGADRFNIGSATLLAADVITGNVNYANETWTSATATAPAATGAGGGDTLAINDGTYDILDDYFKNVSSTGYLELNPTNGFWSYELDYSLNLGIYAKSKAGISTIDGSKSSGLRATVETAAFNTAATFYGGVGNDLVLVDDKPTYLKFLASTYSLGGGTDTLIVGNSAANTWGDTDFTNIRGVEILSLAGSDKTVPSAATFVAVTFADQARQAGIVSVFGTNSNDSFTQLAIDTLSISFFGDDGNDTLALVDRNMILNDSFNGGGGIDALTIGTASNSLTGTDFANYTGMEKLILTGASAITLNSGMVSTGLSSVFGGAGASTFTQTAAFTSGLSIAGGSTGGDLFILSNSYFLTSEQDSIYGGGVGANTNKLQLGNSAVLNDTIFANVKQIGSLVLSGTSSVTLGDNATAAGITAVTGGTGSGSFTQTSTTTAISFTGGASADLFTINSTALALPGEYINGGSAGTDTLSITSSSNLVLTDSSFSRLTSIEVLKLSNTVNTVTVTPTSYAKGIVNIIGGNNDDTFNASAYTASITLDGGGKAITTDSFTGGSAADLFVLANSNGSYYGTTTGYTSNRNYAIVNITSNANVSGNASSDKLQLNQNDYDANLYSLGSIPNSNVFNQQTKHFGLYDNGKFVADVYTNFDVAVSQVGTDAFLNPNNNHVTYV